MKIEPGTMCLACGERPATCCDGTVPLCSKCSQLAKKGSRGVQMKPTSKPKLKLVKKASRKS
jgi:hypothetical protein